jgi:hypothetical protein
MQKDDSFCVFFNVLFSLQGTTCAGARWERWADFSHTTRPSTGMQDSLARGPIGRFFGQITDKEPMKTTSIRKKIEAEDIIKTVF